MMSNAVRAPWNAEIFCVADCVTELVCEMTPSSIERINANTAAATIISRTVKAARAEPAKRLLLMSGTVGSYLPEFAT